MTNAFGSYTLAVVGMPSTPLALCSANFFARFAFSSDNLSGMLALEINTERSRISEQQKQNELSSLKNDQLDSVSNSTHRKRLIISCTNNCPSR